MDCHRNPLVAAWLERERSRLLERELRRQQAEIREMHAQLRPMLERERKAREARRRQDGPNGFVLRD